MQRGAKIYSAENEGSAKACRSESKRPADGIGAARSPERRFRHTPFRGSWLDC